MRMTVKPTPRAGEHRAPSARHPPSFPYVDWLTTDMGHLATMLHTQSQLVKAQVAKFMP